MPSSTSGLGEITGKGGGAQPESDATRAGGTSEPSARTFERRALQMKKSLWLIALLTLVISACAPAAPATQPPAAAPTEAPAAAAPTEAPKAASPGMQMESAQVAAQFFSDADYTKSLDLM